MPELYDYFSSPASFVHLAVTCYILGLLTRRELLLRSFILLGTFFYILYYYFIAETPLWEAIWTSVIMGLANLIGLAALLVGRSPLSIPAANRDLYPRFQHLPPGDFGAIVRRAQRRVLTEAEVVTREGHVVDRLTYVISGVADVEKRGESFKLPPGLFSGEVAFMTGGTSVATTTLPPGAEILQWDFGTLKTLAARRPRFKLALEAMISRDLAMKVGMAVAPRQASYMAEATA